MMFFVRALPDRILAPNGGTRAQVVDEDGATHDAPRNADHVVSAMYSLGDATFHTVLNTQEQPYPQFHYAVVRLTFYIKHGARKCPRCRRQCQCFRPRTPSNFGGDISTPILDALVKHDIIGGKTWEYVDEVQLRIREAIDAGHEGILVEITEADDDEEDE